jgi:F420-dependent oxidoreductase-like protein
VRVALMIEGQGGVTWPQWLALARTAEKSGIQALFRSDHYTSGDGHGVIGSLDAWTTLAGLAAVTERIRLGTLVSPVTFRHPSLLARSVVTVDHISNGRVELGMGTGWMELEHRAFGFPFPSYDERIVELAEQVEIVHREWTEEAFDFAGRRYELRDARARPFPVQRPHPPLIIGGMGKAPSVAIAARWADEYNSYDQLPRFFSELRPRLDAALRDAGREPGSVPMSLMAGIAVAGDEAGVSAQLSRLAGGGDPHAFLARVGDSFIAGTPEQVVERLREHEAAGVGRVYLQHLAHDDLETVELIGRQLVPALA